jgi:hypothetical protein
MSDNEELFAAIQSGDAARLSAMFAAGKWNPNSPRRVLVRRARGKQAEELMPLHFAAVHGPRGDCRPAN